MKSNIESRKRFKERIEEALKSVTDNEELAEALAIVEDLDEIVEINALIAEYFYYVKNKGYERWDYYNDNDYDNDNFLNGNNMAKMYDYIIHRMDVFLGTGVHGGIWVNSQHWISTMLKELAKKAEKDGWNYKESAPKKIGRAHV